MLLGHGLLVTCTQINQLQTPKVCSKCIVQNKVPVSKAMAPEKEVEEHQF